MIGHIIKRITGMLGGAKGAPASRQHAGTACSCGCGGNCIVCKCKEKKGIDDRACKKLNPDMP